MKNFKKFLVLLLSVIMLNGMAQQQSTSKISFRDVQGNNQGGAADAWEACPTASIFSQPPSSPTGSWTGFTSDSFFGYLVYENYTGVAQPIGTVHFWGLNLVNVSGSWNFCDEDPMPLEIKFYQDNAGSPGTAVYSETVQVTRDATGIFYADFPLYHYQAVLSNSVDLPGGWISIQGISAGGTDDCVFLWMSSQAGDGNAFQWDDPNMNQTYFDLSLCFEAGAPAEVPVASWALVIGVVLIAGSVLLRYRHII